MEELEDVIKNTKEQRKRKKRKNDRFTKWKKKIKRSSSTIGSIWMVASMAAFAIEDALVKAASDVSQVIESSS